MYTSVYMDSTDHKDRQAYAFISQELTRSGVMPSLRAIAKVVGYSSPRSVQLQLKRLQKRGWIRISRGLGTEPIEHYICRARDSELAALHHVVTELSPFQRTMRDFL